MIQMKEEAPSTKFEEFLTFFNDERSEDITNDLNNQIYCRKHDKRGRHLAWKLAANWLLFYFLNWLESAEKDFWRV